MAERRMLSRAASEDAPLNRLSIESQLMYVMTLPHLDRDGLITGHPRLLWAKATPLRLELLDRAGPLIEEWVQQGLVIRYAGADGPVLFFKGFRKHQHGMDYNREAPSRFPPPPGWTRTRHGLVPDDEELRAALAACLDPRSAYRKVLEAGPSSEDEVATNSRAGRDRIGSGSRQSRVQDQSQRSMADDDDGQSVMSATPGSGDRGECEGGAHSPDPPPAGARTAAVDDATLAAFCVGMVREVFGETTWDDAAGYIDDLDEGGRLRLAGWLWKCYVRPEWANRPENPIGVGFIKTMMKRGAVASLTPGERQQMAHVLAAWADDHGGLLFGDAAPGERKKPP